MFFYFVSVVIMKCKIFDAGVYWCQNKSNFLVWLCCWQNESQSQCLTRWHFIGWCSGAKVPLMNVFMDVFFLQTVRKCHCCLCIMLESLYWWWYRLIVIVFSFSGLYLPQDATFWWLTLFAMMILVYYRYFSQSLLHYLKMSSMMQQFMIHQFLVQVTAALRWWCSSPASRWVRQPLFFYTTRSPCWTPSWPWSQRLGSAWLWACSPDWWPCWYPPWDSSSAAFSWEASWPSLRWWWWDSSTASRLCGCLWAARWLPASSSPSSRCCGRNSLPSSTHRRWGLAPSLCARTTWLGRRRFQIRFMTCSTRGRHVDSAGLTGPSLGSSLLWAWWVCWCSGFSLPEDCHTEQVSWESPTDSQIVSR